MLDRCLQLHGGYSYMLEYPIARAYLHALNQRIYGGTNEIMKEIMGRSMGFSALPAPSNPPASARVELPQAVPAAVVAVLAGEFEVAVG